MKIENILKSKFYNTPMNVKSDICVKDFHLTEFRKKILDMMKPLLCAKKSSK